MDAAESLAWLRMGEEVSELASAVNQRLKLVRVLCGNH